MTKLETSYFIFCLLYLVLLSWSADKYHKRLKKISALTAALNHPKAKKEKIQAEMQLLKPAVKKNKRNSYQLLIMLFLIQEIAVWVVTTEMGKYNLEGWYREICYPLICLASASIILLVIHWLKGKGGGVPKNEFMDRFGTGN